MSLILYFSLLLLVFHIPPSTLEPLTVECRNNYVTPNTNYTVNSIFDTNLNLLLPSLSSSVSFLNKSFYNTAVGEDPNRVYGQVLCRGDTTPSICRNCTEYASNDILSQGQGKSSGIWYDHCQVLYSDTNFLASPVTPWWFWVSSLDNVTDSELEPFKKSLGELMGDLANKAAYEPWRGMFATGGKNYTGFKDVYGLVQCKPVISGEDCHKCLQDAISKLPECCDWRIRGRVIGAVCNLRFEMTKFYGESLVAGPAPSPSLPPPNGQTNAGRESSRRRLWLIILPVGFSIILLVFIKCHLQRRKVQREENHARELPISELFNNRNDRAKLSDIGKNGPELQLFSFSNVLAATDNFSAANKLGEGGFGPVYKGKLLNEQDVAVKRLSRSSGQGLEEFKNEVSLISKLQHNNLVKLIGMCVHGEEKILIYEYMPNKSLDFFLFDQTKRDILDWEKRVHIIDGIAQGLLYLHKYSRLKIIHRDLKASNILLDGDMNPKISDFGMARMFSANQSEANTNRVVGTYGYMSPEYAMEGLFSVKSDVFSFGVLLLEIMTSKRNTSFHHFDRSLNLLGYAWELWNEGRGIELIDPVLVDSSPAAELTRYIHVALLCVQERATDRPTMSEVISFLNNQNAAMLSPKQPAFFLGRNAPTASLPTSEARPCSLNDVTVSTMGGR